MTALVVDPSALVAIAWREPGAQELVMQLRDAEARLLAAPSVVEVGIVLEGRAPDQVGVASRMVQEWELEVVSFDERLSARAIDAFRRFGKGRHPARLNFGDCLTYALAEERGLPVLCVGDEFARTDLEIIRPG